MSTDKPTLGFPKSVRILRRSDFRKVYDEGSRYSCKWFAAFFLARPGPGPQVGFTVSRALGKAVARNRMKRRMREAVRLNLALLPVHWSIVFNPRKPLLEAPFQTLELEVRKLFTQCVNS